MLDAYDQICSRKDVIEVYAKSKSICLRVCITFFYRYKLLKSWEFVFKKYIVQTFFYCSGYRNKNRFDVFSHNSVFSTLFQVCFCCFQLDRCLFESLNEHLRKGIWMCKQFFLRRCYIKKVSIVTPMENYLRKYAESGIM